MAEGNDIWLIDDVQPANPPPNHGTQRPSDFDSDLSNPFHDPFQEPEHEIRLEDAETNSLDIELNQLDSAGRTVSQENELDGSRGLYVDAESSRFDIRRLWRRYILRRKGYDVSGHGENEASMGHRVVYINEPAAQAKYLGNHISTTKYNVATFIPKFLFEQFSKYANLFFLATALIQQVPHVSPTNRYTTIGTLMVVLLTSATKELVEDFKRWNSDNELNNAKVQVLDPDSQFWIEKRWLRVKVGDIIRIESEQPIPADLILLASSEPEGLCYVETSNLDGETNLKIKQSRPETAQWTTARALSIVSGRIESEHPNSSLYTYEGTLSLNGSAAVPLSPDQMLLRGTSLRNTAWIHGVVVFTGHETKLMRNATATPIKRTAVEHMINLQIVFLFSILFILAVMSSLGNVVKLHQWRSKMWYLQLTKTSATSTFFLDLLTYWILFSNLVPISLFVTVEIIKFYQGWLISNDLEMYDRTTDTPAVCRTSSLVEELGQIQYIFSDKTGTLTRNVMEFKACCVDGKVYSAEIPEEKSGIWENLETMASNQTTATHTLLTLLAACHTVIPEHCEDGSIKYQASSPDEGALVEGTAALGYKFLSRKPNAIVIETPDGQQLKLQLLNICEFNSTRKRMSTVFRFPDGRIRLLIKGADTVIFERLANPQDEETATPSLEEFAGLGLRTLCLAMREISEEEYRAWSKEYDAAATSLSDRGEKLEAVAEKIERDLELVGVTAIEDKLQDGVPETIHALQDAGLKIWVLTGDRQETAINVGMSCKLLSEDMNLLVINEPDSAAVHENIRDKLRAIKDAPDISSADFESLALVIDGSSLAHALLPPVDVDFLELAVMCKAVICCRVSPLQKALVVKLVKSHLKALLLAIGDGANDVSMIQAAHVGVGISGMEGQQAARSADVAIGQFRFLKRLLIVHGSWSYNRLSRAILYSFYKNIALYLTQFWFVFLNGFSGQTIYESWTVTFYNVICTVLPPFSLGILDQFVSARLLERYPQLYRLGQQGIFLSVGQFWQWIVNGIYHSLIIFWFSVGTYAAGNVLTNGKIANHWTWGTACYTSCVLTVLGKAALVSNMWNRYTLIAIPGSFLIWLAYFPPYATIAPHINVSKEYYGVLSALYPTLVFWAMILLITAACLSRDIAWKYWRRMYKPEYYHYVQEIQKYKLGDQQPRMDQFQRAIRKARQVTRMRKQRGYAFSQTDEGAARVVRAYETTSQ